MKKKILVALASLHLVAGTAWAVPVGLELVLLVDVSGSVTTTEYNLQKGGYAQAFQSAAVQDAILNSVGGAIAVTYVEWSGHNEQSQLVGWTLIDSAAAANAFAAAILGTSRAFSGFTAVQDALISGGGLFANNGFEGDRWVIDMSGDGTDNATQTTGGCNVAANPACGRDLALAAGVDTINGIVIGGGNTVLNYYNANVMGGANAFVIQVDDFDEFGPAIQDKLIREVTPVPEPATLLLIGSGLIGLALRRRRR